jgi:small subunit ribosomal protein S6
MALREYELMYIVRPTVAEDALPASMERVDSIITGLGGEIAENNPWGKRRLAYPIEKFEEGYYVVSKIRMEPEQTRELESQLAISEEVIRHMLVV